MTKLVRFLLYEFDEMRICGHRSWKMVPWTAQQGAWTQNYPSLIKNSGAGETTLNGRNKELTTIRKDWTHAIWSRFILCPLRWGHYTQIWITSMIICKWVMRQLCFVLSDIGYSVECIMVWNSNAAFFIYNCNICSYICNYACSHNCTKASVFMACVILCYQ